MRSLPFPGFTKKEKSRQQSASGKLQQATIIGLISAGRKYALPYLPNIC
jgi:hypothetical protein